MRASALQSEPCSHHADPGRPLGPSGVRHRVVAMAFLLGVILYLDRAALSVLAPALRRDLHIGPMAIGAVFTAFVWGYALFNIPAGWLGDRFGARRVLAAIVLVWSLFTGVTAAARNLGSLLVIRFLFGAAESGATPNITQSFSRWIPLAERARAQGFYFAGMSAGMAIAPPLATLSLLQWGWRATFVALSIFGVGWVIVWYYWYRDHPVQHGSAIDEDSVVPDHSLNWHKMRRSWNLWSILLMYFTYGYTGYIYITWFPSYLIEARHMPAAVAGGLAAVPGLLGVFAKPLGGWLSDRLTQRRGVVYGRRFVGVLGFGMAAAAVLPGLYLANGYLAVISLAVADGAAALAHGVCFAVCIDTGVKRAGTISGLMLTSGSLGNAASALLFGFFLQFTGSWAAPFLIGMAANLIGALLWLRIDPEEQFA